jgi:light-regulated signal transduction histidine kinase (bacteriophytochrome)
MGKLIDDLLAFSKLGRKEVSKSNVDMQSMVKNICDDLGRAPDFRARIDIGELEPVLADFTLMNHVWTNLLSNAIKYSANKEKPLVKIRSNRNNGMITYSITDNGAGFDMKYADKLFGVFQRLHSSDDFEGTGVGLAIVHRIISRHDGKIWAEGSPGEGATFYFSLPSD